MDEPIHKILVILVFFMAISQVEKNKSPLHHPQTSTKAQQERKNEMKNKKKT
jgi:biopolymer transport protein ExbD